MLVSIFGDLAHAPGDQIDGPLLTRLTDGMQIKPEAVRVALHRLRNDGWIASEKSGRTAHHSLTPSALRQRNEAAPLIYTRTADMPQGWQMAVIPQAETDLRNALSKTGFAPITSRVLVAHDAVPAPPGVLLAEGTQVPDWAASDLVPADLTAEFETLLAALQQTRAKLGRTMHNGMNLTETALLRCLIVHHWRRLVLRHPYLPPALLGADWPGHQCRDLVCDLLDALPRPALTALSGEARRTAS